MENSFLPDNSENDIKHSMFNIKKVAIYALGLLVFLFLISYFLFSAPLNFPVGAVVKIEPGMSLRGISSVLEKENIIRSRVAFESFVIIFGGELHTVSANYLFEKKLSVWRVALRILKGEHHMPPVSVTIPEGFNVEQIGDAFAPQLQNFNKNNFLLEARPKEGYLFPDTYYFLTTDNEKKVVSSMNGNFEKKIKPLLPMIALSGKTEKDIIIMASIIEREAKGDADREIISGILWKRISVGMPLQVDAAMETYKEKRLPKNPIGNPGLEAIKSAISPQNSAYLYYLHDKNGDIHYAKTFTEHRANIKRYLSR